MGIGLSQPENSDIQAAAVIEIELIGLIDDSLSIDGSTEV